ncbi:hypothetical protein AXX17_AT4G02260 [Arabidopsis thaliana]|uniref:chloroplast protein-transporting ATPase n=1 Tax=Arabidopsis thaliana TaxID=3702 RepID=A0A178URB9_ARATH|nr:hypothetical protein AXX17_AT4G02260 [Arabidopsis thaliana]
MMVTPLCDSQLLYHRPSISPTASQFVIADGIILRQNRLLSSSSFWGTKFGNTVKLGVSGCSSCSRKRSTSVNASLGGLLGGIFKGSDNGESTRQQYASIVASVNRLETEISALSDSELRERTDALKQRAQKGESMDSLLPEAFAVVREASKRVLGLRPFDVQLIGGMVLHKGEIAEMRTGEGKTLVAILPAYLNALSGKGVHVVTVNDYLARRDCEWVGQVPRFLGLKVGLIQQNMTPEQRKENYLCDITYVTNSELGFDYLRDNLATEKC